MTGRWTYRASAAGVLVLAAAAFTLSYDALHQLALDSRVRPTLAWLWPVVIDGTIVVALLTVLAAKRTTRSASYPWALAGLFSAASVAFNIAHAPDRPVAQLVFAMAPIALVLTTHLLMQQAGWRHPQNSPDSKAAIGIPVADERDMLAHQRATAVAVAGHTQPPPDAVLDRSALASDHDVGMAGRGPNMPGPYLHSRTAKSGPTTSLQTRAQQIYANHRAAGRQISGRELARELGTSERHGRRLLADLRTSREGAASRNGDGPARHKQAGPMST
jgi:Protein of unknown function (DUF2637)